MSKWSFLKQKYPTMPIDADRFQKMNAILDSPAPVELLTPSEIGKEFRLRDLSDYQLNRFLNQREKVALQLADKVEVNGLELEAVKREFYRRFEEAGEDNKTFEDGVQLIRSEDVYPVVTDSAALIGWIKTQGLEDMLTLNYNTMKSMVKEILLPAKGKTPGALPPGVDVFYQPKLTRRGGPEKKENQ